MATEREPEHRKDIVRIGGGEPKPFDPPPRGVPLREPVKLPERINPGRLPR